MGKLKWTLGWNPDNLELSFNNLILHKTFVAPLNITPDTSEITWATCFFCVLENSDEITHEEHKNICLYVALETPYEPVVKQAKKQTNCLYLSHKGLFNIHQKNVFPSYKLQ